MSRSADPSDRSAPQPVEAPPPRALGIKPLAVVVTGNHGTEITDTLPIVELLGATGELEVVLAAPKRERSPFTSGLLRDGGVDFVPDYSFAELDATGRIPSLIVVPFLSRWKQEDAAVLHWLRSHDRPSTIVLSISGGGEIVAAAGLFDGVAATAHHGALDRLEREFPKVRWTRGARWVGSGNRFASSTLAAGIDATLAIARDMYGFASAEAAARSVGYRARHLDGGRAPMPDSRVGALIAAAYRWDRERVAIAIADGDEESRIAGLVATNAALLDTSLLTVAQERRIVKTKYGVQLVPRTTLSQMGHVDELVVVSQPAAAGKFGYDFAITEIARRRGNTAAARVAEMLDYASGRELSPVALPGMSPHGDH